MSETSAPVPFREPARAIFTLDDLDKYIESETHAAFVNFVQTLCDRVKGHDLQTHATSPIGQRLLNLISDVEATIEDCPPSQQSQSRFGNKAFRSFYELLVSNAPGLVREVVGESAADPTLVAELVPYILDSFGNKTRIDYGTGHEATFVMFLFGLHKAGVVADEDLAGLGLCVLPAYFRLIDRLVDVYSLEPAGTHGAWSLDDYHFLPFLLGAAQLVDNPHGIQPMSALESSERSHYLDRFLFMQGFERVAQTKRSVTLSEGSPLLSDMALLPSFAIIAPALMKMFAGEVLDKFPVAQHFLFGSLLPAPWCRTASLSSAELPAPLSGPALLAVQARTSRRGGAGLDPFTKYFGTIRPTRHSHSHTHSHSHSHQHQQHQHQHQHALPLVTNPLELNADSHVLLPEDGGIDIKGFVIAARRANLSDAIQLQELAEQGLDFPLPEMVFANSHVTLSHRNSHTTIRFCAADALERCKLKYEMVGRNKVTVPAAPSWQERSESGEIPQVQRSHDWTFTTDYQGSFIREDGASLVTPSPHRIDYDRLRIREPILWYEEVVLFESELDDFGSSKLSIKARVMPSCFFLLMRCFVRVDGTVARVWDTRIYHEFGSDIVVVEHTRRELPFDRLVSLTGKPNRSSFYHEPQNFIDHMDLVLTVHSHLPL